MRRQMDLGVANTQHIGGFVRPSNDFFARRFLYVFRSGCFLAFDGRRGVSRSGHLADDCQLVSDIRPRRLRSSDSGFCAIRRSRTTYGDRCFAAAGPRVWNSLPTELRQSDSLAQFKRRLKTHLFGLWDHSALWHWLVNSRYRNILTYLLTYPKLQSLLSNERVNSQGPSEQKPVKNFTEKGVWAYPGTAQFLNTPIISGIPILYAHS